VGHGSGRDRAFFRFLPWINILSLVQIMFSGAC
jgi:hypothetical protein